MRYFLLLIISSMLTLTGCYNASSDDELRTVPATNNPHHIQDKSRPMSGIGY